MAARGRHSRGPRAKPVTQGGAIGSVALDFFFIKIQVIYSVVAASGVWQSGSVTRMCSFLPPLPLSVTTGS